MSSLPEQFIPASPGYSVLRFSFLDRKVTEEHVRSTMQVRPVIGWRVVEGVVLPVALGDLEQPVDGIEAVIVPGGMIFDVAGKSWKGVDAWARDVTAAWKAWREAHGQASPPAAVQHPLQNAIIGLPH